MSKPTPLKSLIDDTGYKTALSRLSELQRDRDVAQRKCEEIRGQISRLSAVAAKGDELDRRAASLIAGDGGTAATLAQLREELATTQDHARVIERAIQLQQGALEKLRRDVSLEICRQISPQYREIARRIGLAYRELIAAVVAEQQFRIDLQNRWVDHDALVSPVPPGFANAGDVNSAPSRFLLRLVEQHYFSIDDLPAPLKPYVPGPQPAPTIPTKARSQAARQFFG
ncbi:MAG: hypothetical protein FJY54_12135 [Betaproteobacteria bacterium]|nr:hypothetical protein [Betaproteobacteria bacterium]